MSIFKEPISQIIWEMKYRYRQGVAWQDQSIADTWQRVAKAVAEAEKRPARRDWQKKFYQILDNFQFIPGGRILAGAGTSYQITLFNCFVMNIAEDSLKGIFDALREGALTLQMGGGIGYDFSVLRPEGDLVKKTGLSASGPVSFMRIWDTTCSVLVSTGARRGAMMGVMRCDHPDIEAFIDAKSDPHELRHFNVSVMVTDTFMQAVKNNEYWALVFPCAQAKSSKEEIVYRPWGNSFAPVPCRIYRRIKARALWDKIIHSAYEYAEPGVLFYDTINGQNNLWYREQINAANPCGEIPLPSYGACDLGAVNLTQFISAPFTSRAAINWSSLEETVKIATRFLDNMIDVSRYPLKMQQDQAAGARRIGLGLTGLADAWVMLGIRYGSPQSIVSAKEIMQRIAEATWHSSIALAQEKGAFPFFEPAYSQGKFVLGLNETLQRELIKYGVRNSHHNTIAPTGTTSLLANNVSNGIEPIFKSAYNRHVRTTNNETQTFFVKDYAYRLWQESGPHQTMPPAWMEVADLQPEAHLQVQAALQPFIDNAISKTINIPADFPFAGVENIYTNAHHLGLKGCTIFRPNPTTGSVLEAVPASNEDTVDQCCQH